MSNPFLPVSEFPDFPAMTPAAAEEALPQLLAAARARVDELERTATPTWEGFVRPLEDAVRPFHEAWGLVGHLLSVCNSPEWRAVQARFQGEAVEFSLRTAQSRRFYELAKATPAETPVRRRILDKMIQGAELAGVALEDAPRARFNALQTELATLGNDFRDAVLDATKAWHLDLSDPAEVAGVPANIRAMVATEGGTAEKGPWRVTTEDAVYVPFMKHCACRAVRERLYRARATRAAANTPRIDAILAHEAELAALLGYNSAADLSLATKCAPSVTAVHAMIDELAAAARPVAVREDADLAAFAATCPGAPALLAPWDISFYAERLRERNYAYSEEELARHFNFPVVLDGLFKLVSRLFGVTVEGADWTAPVWQEDVRFFRVCDEKGATIAHFYLDPYSRPETKGGGAWMNEIRTREVRPDGTVTLPLALLCCNQARPDADGRCLMTFRDVETLFHEFGHALQHMLTRVDEAGASGLNLVEWDAVELASQFMENWCAEPSVAARFAFDAETHAPIPRALLEKVRAARNYRAGNATLRQLAFAKTDMLLHDGSVSGVVPNEVKERVFDEMNMPFIPEDRFLESFTHIFGGGYAAGYYSYKWSEVMSADAFAAFQEAGLEDEAALVATGRRYRETILALGGSEDALTVFWRFRGRAPSTEALLRQQGLI